MLEFATLKEKSTFTESLLSFLTDVPCVLVATQSGSAQAADAGLQR